MNCQYCKNSCIKAGFQKDRTQKFFCKGCNKYQQAQYKRTGFKADVSDKVRTLMIEGLGIRSIARVLGISITTVVSKIKRIADQTQRPVCFRSSGVFEIDELWTFVGKKENETWITYSLDRKSKEVVDFRVGGRTKENIRNITDGVLALNPKSVCTDGLNTYRGLLPKPIHRIGLPHTRRIERFNLNLRTHLKRLSRKTIRFSKNREMLEACLRIYFGTRAETHHVTGCRGSGSNGFNGTYSIS